MNTHMQFNISLKVVKRDAKHFTAEAVTGRVRTNGSGSSADVAAYKAVQMAVVRMQALNKTGKELDSAESTRRRYYIKSGRRGGEYCWFLETLAPRWR